MALQGRDAVKFVLGLMGMATAVMALGDMTADRWLIVARYLERAARFARRRTA